MKKRLEDMISYVFGKYDMRTGIDNKIRMEKLLQFCWGDIESHDLKRYSMIMISWNFLLFKALSI